MTDPNPTDQGPAPVALEAVARAFAATRLARRLLDQAGELGAAAVRQARPIPGARRASTKAQVAMEQSARQLADARDRWGALASGLAADLALQQGTLGRRVEEAGLVLTLAEAVAALEAAIDSAAALDRQWAGRLASSRAELVSLAEELSQQLARHDGSSGELGLPPQG